MDFTELMMKAKKLSDRASLELQANTVARADLVFNQVRTIDNDLASLNTLQGHLQSACEELERILDRPEYVYPPVMFGEKVAANAAAVVAMALEGQGPIVVTAEALRTALKAGIQQGGSDA